MSIAPLERRRWTLPFLATAGTGAGEDRAVLVVVEASAFFSLGWTHTASPTTSFFFFIAALVVLDGTGCGCGCDREAALRVADGVAPLRCIFSLLTLGLNAAETKRRAEISNGRPTAKGVRPDGWTAVGGGWVGSTPCVHSVEGRAASCLRQLARHFTHGGVTVSVTLGSFGSGKPDGVLDGSIKLGTRWIYGCIF